MFGLATDEQWEKMKKFIKSDKYKKEDFFVFETLGVGDRVVPNRYQRITKSALEVMADDAKKGVSLMLNHNEGQLGVQAIPIGKVFDSRIGPGTQEGEENALYLTHYILRDDSKVDGYSKNDIINLIESGILEDTSVGFSVSRKTATCNICHKPYMGGECHHWAGFEYVVDEETGKKRTCIVEINAPEYSERHAGNIMLNEDSLVYDGAYSNAMIQQSKNGGTTVETPNGKLKVLGDKEKVKSDLIGYSTKNGLTLMYKPFEEEGGKLMDEAKENSVKLSAEEETEETVEQTTEETVEATAETTDTQSATENATESDTQAEDVAETTQETVEQKAATNELFSITEDDVKESFGELKVTKDMILTFAKEGKEYRDQVIEETLKSGVRAMGNSFQKESFKKSFELMSTKDILNVKDTYEEEVKQKFGNSRVSKAEETKANEKFEFSKTPDVSTLKTSNY